MIKQIRRFWRYLHRLDEQTRQYVQLDWVAIVEDLSSTEREKNVTQRIFTDGGQENDDNGDTDRSAFDVDEDYDRRKQIGFILGPLIFAAIYLAPTPEGLDPSGQAVAAVTAWVAIWWISEAIPIPATSLLPIILFPLTGAIETADATAPYADPLIFLFMGGFFLAMAMQRWDLHRRIALLTIKAVGTNPSRIILGFMLATAFLSMWVSNSATVMMMVPIALAVVYQTAEMVKEGGPDIPVGEGEFTFGVALMLCIAYGASAGGVATLIGTPPNLIFAGAVGELFDQNISFGQWMLYGLPISVIMLSIIYIYITQLVLTPQFEELPGGASVIDEELSKLGDMNRQEQLVLIVFAGMAAGWLSAEFILAALLPGIEEWDSIIAIAGAMVLFLTPTTVDGERTFLLDWTHAVEIPWGVILLFGGGLSIAAGFEETGLATWLAEQLTALEGVSLVILLLVAVLLAISLTEVTSNTATAAILMPVLGALALGISVHPYTLMVAAATAASLAFMLPVATPPNAIVFGSGYITIPQMAKIGFWINIIAVFLVTVLVLYWLPAAWGIELGELPTWAD